MREQLYICKNCGEPATLEADSISVLGLQTAGNIPGQYMKWRIRCPYCECKTEWCKDAMEAHHIWMNMYDQRGDMIERSDPNRSLLKFIQ